MRFLFVALALVALCGSARPALAKEDEANPTFGLGMFKLELDVKQDEEPKEEEPMPEPEQLPPEILTGDLSLADAATAVNDCLSAGDPLSTAGCIAATGVNIGVDAVTSVTTGGENTETTGGDLPTNNEQTKVTTNEQNTLTPTQDPTKTDNAGAPGTTGSPGTAGETGKADGAGGGEVSGGDNPPKARETPRADRSPVIFIHGVMGSRLSVRPAGGAAFDCFGNTNTATHWQANSAASQGWVPTLNGDCKARMLMLTNQGNKAVLNANFETGIAGGFGSLASMETLWGTPATSPWSAQYFWRMVEHFVAQGWVRGTNLFGAPYDWRFGPGNPHYMAYFRSLFAMIHRASTAAGRGVTVAAHSMGNLVFLDFLKKVEAGDLDASLKRRGYAENEAGRKRWLERHITSYASMAAPLMGAPSTYIHLISGANLASTISQDVMRLMARSVDAVSVLSPAPAEAAEWATDKGTDGSSSVGLTIGTTTYGLTQIGDAVSASSTATHANFGGGNHGAADKAFFDANNGRNPGTAPPNYVKSGKLRTVYFYADQAGEQKTLLHPHFSDQFVFDASKSKYTKGDGTVPAVSAKHFMKYGTPVVAHQNMATLPVDAGGKLFHKDLKTTCQPFTHESSVVGHTCDHQGMIVFNTQLWNDVIAIAKSSK